MTGSLFYFLLIFRTASLFKINRYFLASGFSEVCIGNGKVSYKIIGFYLL